MFAPLGKCLGQGGLGLGGNVHSGPVHGAIHHLTGSLNGIVRPLGLRLGTGSVLAVAHDLIDPATVIPGGDQVIQPVVARLAHQPLRSCQT